MSRKDYELIAASFAYTIEQIRLRRKDDTAPSVVAASLGRERAVRQAAHDMADRLLIDNPRFDRGRFMRAVDNSEF